jgi:FkbM family methyltransferase
VATDALGSLKYELASKLNRDKYRIVRTNGFRMYVHLSDKGISKDLYLYGSRERFALKFLKSFLEEDDIIIDIGANIGYYALTESQAAPKGRIFATEPSAFNRRILHMNLELNNVDNVRIYPFAFAEHTEGERELYLYKQTNWTSFNKNLNAEIVDTARVRTVSLDDFVGRFMGGVLPTAMRMDVEGFETEIIKGARQTLRDAPKMKIFMEMHPHLLTAQQLDGLLHALEHCRFEVKAIVNDCEPHVYAFLDDKMMKMVAPVPYGVLGAGYDKLRMYLRMNKGTQVFFEKSS